MQSRNVSKIIAVFLLFYLSMSWVAMAPMNIAEWVYLCVLALFLYRAKKIKTSRIDFEYLRITLVLSAAFLISAFVYWVDPLTIQGKSAESQVTRAILKQIYFFLPLPIAFGLRELKDNDLSRFGTLALGIFMALSLTAIQQHWTGFPFHQGIPGVDGRYHATGFLNHHLTIVSIWIFPTFFFLDFSKSIRYRVAAFLGLVVLALAYSRMAWIATLVGLLIYVLMKMPNRRLRLIGVGGFGVVGAGAFFLPSVHERFQQTMGVLDRIELWRTHLSLFMMRPVTGVGLLESQEYSGILQLTLSKTGNVFAGHAHNVPLEILSSSGVLGGIAFLLWVLFVTQKYIQALKIPGVTGLFVAWIVFLLNGLTQVNLFEGKVMHALAWSIGVLLFLTQRRGANETTPH